MDLKTAKEIISEVCDEHIPRHYQVTVPDQEDSSVQIVRLQSKNKEVSFTWDILNPALTEQLLWCDTHSFCAFVLRNVPMEEETWTKMIGRTIRKIKNKFQRNKTQKR